VKIEQVKKDAVHHPHVFNISLISSPLLFNFKSVIRGLAESVVTYGMHVTLYKLPSFQADSGLSLELRVRTILPRP
jgi:hypothetical protein